MISPKDEAWTEQDVHKSETALLSFKCVQQLNVNDCVRML